MSQICTSDTVAGNLVLGSAITGDVSAAESLLLAGKRNPITQGGSVIAITLPALADASGKEWEFYVQTAGAQNITITPTDADKIYGTIRQLTNDIVAANATDVVTIIGGTAVIGDWVKLSCDGVVWSLDAVSSADGGITSTG